MLEALATADRPALLRLTRVLVFATVLLALVMPFSAPLLVGGAFVLQVFWHWRDHGACGLSLDGARWPRAALPIALLIGYFALRLFPGPTPVEAVIGVASMAIYAILAFLTFRLQIQQNHDVQCAIATSFLAAFAVGATVHAFEVLTGFAGRRLFWTWVPQLRPRAEKLTFDGDTVTGIVIFIANHVSAILTAMLVPVAMLARRATSVGLTPPQTIAVWASVAVAVVGIVLSDHATSKLAVVAMALAWGLFRVCPRATGPVLGTVWLASTLAVVPLALIVYHAEGYRWPKAYSAQHRIVIWGVTAEKTLDAPLFGIGMGQTARRDEFLSPLIKYVPGTNIPIATGRHAHNMFLQTWHEAGVIGALLLLLAGIPLIRWIARAPIGPRPFLAAAFLGTVVSASVSYGLLAAWFLATFAVTALFCRFTLAFDDETRPGFE